VATCGLADELAAVRKRARAAGWDTCIVLKEERVVLGRLGRKAIAGDSDETVESAMTEGPSTVRPSIGTDALLDRMRERDLTSLLVTTPDGKLVGLARRSDLA
jgi:Mg/Co/Ni transporter MgtE